MFDYQAGEKYKLTLIMVALAGLIAGMFFTVLLMPTPDASARRRGSTQMTKAMMDPDVTGGRTMSGGGESPGARAQGLAVAAMAQSTPAAAFVDRASAQQFMQNWLPRVWDLSAQTALANQEEAIKWMTPECSAAYRQNIWSPETANQIAGSSLVSEFHIQSMDISDNLADGSVVAKVKGLQVLKAPTGQKQKQVNLEYMLKQTADGMRIAGISEGS